MNVTVAQAAWPAARLGDALVQLARRARLDPSDDQPREIPPAGAHAAWLDACARRLGLEAERHDIPPDDIAAMLRSAGPLLIPLTGTSEGEATYLAMLWAGVFVTPDGTVARLPLDVVRNEICRGIEAGPERRVEVMLDGAGIHGERRARARAALMSQLLADARVPMWTLGPEPDSSWRRLARHARLASAVSLLASLHAAYVAVWVLAWWVIGAAALGGRFDRGWLLAWVLLLVTLVPLRTAALRLQGRLAISVGARLKERLLAATFRLDPDTVGRQGAGQLLARVIEVDAVESLALHGGFAAAIGTIELVAAALALGIASSPWLFAALVCWCVLLIIVGVRYFARAEAWSGLRLAMTHGLVERMIGHRTRAIQQPHAEWHDDEDREIERYSELSIRRDRAETILLAIIPQGWLVVALIALGPALIERSIGAPALAAGLGGALLAARAFDRLCGGLWQLADARVAWRQVEPLLAAESRDAGTGSPALAVADSVRAGDEVPVLDARGLTFRYPDRDTPVLRGVGLRVSAHDRVLLEGASGSGKSTLVSLIAGIRAPRTGVLLADGLDRHTLGMSGWRRRIAAAPQFHQNHMLTGTLAFNLLMGRPLPHTQDDEREAMEVCRELGLGPLIERMPGGLQQMVGETGWQLSHGERSRVYLARALLQRARLTIVDEGFEALDAESLDQTMACILRRAPALMAISHR